MSILCTSAWQLDGVTVLTISGEIDLASAQVFEDAVAGVVAEDPHALVIDMSEVQYVGLVGLAILEGVPEKIGETVPFAVVTQCPITSKIIRLVKLDGFLSLCESLEDALLSMKKIKAGARC